jgi:cellulose synthase/poly-beta-1,6-N-acetylglucosamine synthase-like glycosyltransferase
MLKFLFWILIVIVLYTYVGYTVLLIVLNLIKKIFNFNKPGEVQIMEYPEVTLLIAAYNEKNIIGQKIQNSYAINYPKEKLKILWITDGSDDGTHEELIKYPDIQVLHHPVRQGKTAALNRAMKFIQTQFVVFCDANTMLAKDSIRNLIGLFSDPRVGCVAGAKHIARNTTEIAAGAGEGAYWRYESFIKKLESDFHSTLGAAGELYAIRTSLYETIDPDLIIDDFANSLLIACKGNLIKYAKNAFATEASSINIKEELKRKIRIASGGIQILIRMPYLLNVFKYGFISIEYFSHKVLRWTIVPWIIPSIFFINLYICYSDVWVSTTYNLFFGIQLLFYLIVIAGGLFEKHATRFKFFFLPYYLIIMNYAQIAGFFRYLRGKHTVVWEKVKRT